MASPVDGSVYQEYDPWGTHLPIEVEEQEQYQPNSSDSLVRDAAQTASWVYGRYENSPEAEVFSTSRLDQAEAEQLYEEEPLYQEVFYEAEPDPDGEALIWEEVDPSQPNDAPPQVFYESASFGHAPMLNGLSGESLHADLEVQPTHTELDHPGMEEAPVLSQLLWHPVDEEFPHRTSVLSDSVGANGTIPGAGTDNVEDEEYAGSAFEGSPGLPSPSSVNDFAESVEPSELDSETQDRPTVVPNGSTYVIIEDGIAEEKKRRRLSSFRRKFGPRRSETYDLKSPHYRYKDELIDMDSLQKLDGTVAFCCEKFMLRWKRFFHDVCPCVYALFYSKENEYSFYKAVFGFPFGVLLGLGFYYCLIDRLKLPEFLRFMLGSMVVTFLALGYARSTKVRCIAWLIFPCFCGKTGRSILLTMAVGALLTGPVSNTMANFKESVRSVTCMTEMMINITLTRFELTGKPIFNIVKGFVGDKRMDKLGRKIRSALSPVKNEVEGTKETREAQIRAERMDAEQRTNRNDFFKKNEQKNAVVLAKSDGGVKTKAFKIDTSYLKKLDYRCNDIWGKAVDTCKKSFSDAWDRCLKAIPVIGYLLCWPTKLDFFCYLVKLFPSPVKCDSSKILNMGFGGAYGEGDGAGKELEQGMEVKLEYKVTPKAGKVDAVNIKDMQTGLRNEFSKKQRFFNFVVTLFQRILAFMFVRIFITSFVYFNLYHGDIRFDNNFITDYFRKIERRRRERARSTLLPLKKLEAKAVIEPTKWKLLPEERKEFAKGTLRLCINIITFLLIFLFDHLLFEILSIVARHSYIVYTQRGVHDISLEIKGGGVLARLVRKVLKGFHERTEVDRKFDNLKCLPYPVATASMAYVKVFGTVGLVWVLLYFEAYGLRLRSWICSFFYPKRQKRRILHLYNNTLKKRAGYARALRRQVRRSAREGTLRAQYDTFTALRQQCPYLCFWMNWFNVGATRCAACKERDDGSFIFCGPPGCAFAYCPSCWDDLQHHCYGCVPAPDDESSSSGDEFGSAGEGDADS